MFSLFLTLNACLRYQTPTCVLVGQTMTSFHMHSFIPEDIYEKVVKKEKIKLLGTHKLWRPCPRLTTHPVILAAKCWSFLSSFPTCFVYFTRAISRGSDFYPVTMFSFISAFI